jgi:cytochrome c peroxidase
MNLAWTKHFMWDGAVNHLDVQALAPISHPAEMGEDIVNVVAKLNRSRRYPKAFLQAFGDSNVTGEFLLKALSQFQLTLISSNSKYDKVARKEPGFEFSEQEVAGYQLFKQHCNSCHVEPLFTSGGFENNGLPVDTSLNDWGRMLISGKKEDSLKFKVPSLRNLEYSFPYMHDGRFNTLSEVINHYPKGIHQSPTLSPSLGNGIVLDDREKVDLIAFLLTLTDKDFVFNSNYSFPRE